MQLVDGRIADKIGDKKICRIVVEIPRFGKLLFHAQFHQHDVVGNGSRFFLVVRNKDGRNTAFTLYSADLFSHFHPQLGIQVGERFIQKQEFRPFHQSPGNGNTLLLAA